MHKTGLRRLNPVSAKYRELLLEDIDSGKILIESVERCVCCGSENLDKILDVDRFNLPFGSYLCTDCGLVTTSPRIRNESLPYYYDRYYHPLNYGKESLETQSSLFNPEQGARVFERLKPYIKRENIDVLEIGAGVGDVLSGIRDSAEKSGLKAKVLGTEYSKECIQKCQAVGVEVVSGDSGTVLELKRKFDIVILSHVFEHFVDLKAELDRLKSLLKDHGLIYIEVPGIYKTHLKPYYDFSFLGYSVHAHMYNFTLETLRRVVCQGGFSLLEGSEEAYGVFKIGEEVSKQYDNQYLKIFHYLEFLEENQDFAISQRGLIFDQDRELTAEKKYNAKLKSEMSELDSELSKLRSENVILDANLKNSREYISKIQSSRRILASFRAIPDFYKKHKAYLELLRTIDASEN